MPVPGPLPRTGEQQDIGAAAERCFHARAPLGWRLSNLSGTEDYGLDFQVQTVVDEEVRGIFRVQLKGTRSPATSADDSFISMQLKATTVRYYETIVEPVLLVVCDLSVSEDPVDCALYFVWVRDELRRIDVETLSPEQSYVTFRVPKANRLTSATDLQPQIDAQNELSRAGHAMRSKLDVLYAGIPIESSVEIVKNIAENLGARGASFVDALAATPEGYWIEPIQGSLAERLQNAERLLKQASSQAACAELDEAESSLANATAIEVGSFWFLRGKYQASIGREDDASDSYRRAYEANAQGKYLAAQAEAQFRLRRQNNSDARQYPDLLALLDTDDPHVLLVKSKILASEGKKDAAVEALMRVKGPLSHAARALVAAVFEQHEGTLAHSALGLEDPEMPAGSRQFVLILRACASFSRAMASGKKVTGEYLPASGTAGIDLTLVREAWSDIQAAVDSIRASGWNSNIEGVVDIWAATASILGRQEELLPEFIVIAKLRPHLSAVQSALEVIAGQCGKFDIALEANERQPDSTTRSLRRTLLLHDAKKYGACYRWFRDHLATLDRTHPNFGLAAALAARSAHKLSEPELVKSLSDELELHPHLHDYAALLQYFIAIEINGLRSGESLEQLWVRYQELGRPYSLAGALLHALDPNDRVQAARCQEVFERICEDVEPPVAAAMKVGIARAAQRDWEGLIQLHERLSARVDAGPQMLAFKALALDRMGQTHEARVMLEGMIAGGPADTLALDTYIAIMVRCGFVKEAIGAAELILEEATQKRQRADCIRLIFDLVRHSDPASPRLLALAIKAGSLADQESEIDEGRYLVMFLMATMSGQNRPTAQQGEEFQRRSKSFFIRFPNSEVVRQVEFDKDSSGEQLLAQLKTLLGPTEKKEAFQRRLENQLQRGSALLPFAWRPKNILSSIYDVVHLWETAKISSRDDRKYHLAMVADLQWTPRSASVLKDRTPLLDLTTLVVLFDLGLIEKVIRFFGEVAIAKSTLETLAELTNPVSGSFYFQKCKDLQEALKPHLSSIKQPSAVQSIDEEDDLKEMSIFGAESREIPRLTQVDGAYRLYSDDLAFRIYAADSNNADGICTLDVLNGLQEEGILTRKEAVQILARLCEWRVAVVVRLDDMPELLPDALSSVSDLAQGMKILDEDETFRSVINAIWDFRAPFDGALRHAAGLLRGLESRTSLPVAALAAIMKQWFVKVAMKNDAPPGKERIIVKVISFAGLVAETTPANAARLWAVFRSLIESIHGDQMDEARERQSIRLLGAECANFNQLAQGSGDLAFKALRKGLVEGTSDESDYVEGYTQALTRLKASGSTPIR